MKERNIYNGKFSKKVKGAIVSYATLNPLDLIFDWYYFLEVYFPEKARSIEKENKDVFDVVHAEMEKDCSDRNEYFEEYDESLKDSADWLLQDIWEALNEIAPTGCYFGAHEGNGSCFGFWNLQAV